MKRWSPPSGDPDFSFLRALERAFPEPRLRGAMRAYIDDPIRGQKALARCAAHGKDRATARALLAKVNVVVPLRQELQARLARGDLAAAHASVERLAAADAALISPPLGSGWLEHDRLEVFMGYQDRVSAQLGQGEVAGALEACRKAWLAKNRPKDTPCVETLAGDDRVHGRDVCRTAAALMRLTVEGSRERKEALALRGHGGCQ